MSRGNIKMAWASLRASKWRSFLTMLGVIIGVASVVTIVSLGEGVKKQVVGQINQLGADLITVRPGKIVRRDARGNITGVSLLAAFSSNALSESDYQTIKKSPGVQATVPFSLINGVAKYDDREFDSGFIIASTQDVPSVINQKVQYGNFFSDADQNKNFAVIGRRVADELFKENVPIGKSLEIRGQTFVVQGIFEEFQNAPLSPNSDLNSAIFIPYGTAKQLTNNQTQIVQVLVKPKDPKQIKSTVSSIQSALTKAHGGQNDVTVLRQDENLAITNRVLNLFTSLITGVAAISLLVGGIGIMNIMTVSVSERTKEIGVRKAVGATNRQIRNQFMVEAAVLSLVGGVLGVVASLIMNFGLRIFTNLQPVITWPIMIIAVAVATAVGMFFGVAPAMKAAHKDPIESLRAEI